MKKILLLIALSFSVVAHATNYEVQLLQSLSEGGNSLAYGLNDNGMVVGQSFNNVTGMNEAVVWHNGIVFSIGTQGLARAVNNSGVVVGETGGASIFNPNGRAFMWDSGNYTEIGDLGGSWSGAFDINESGVISGFSCTNFELTCVFSSRGFRYENGVMQNLGTVSSPTGYSRGHGINDAGAIAGRASLVNFTDSDKFLAIWDAANNLTSVTGPSNYSTAESINNNGIIVGNGFTNPNADMRGFVWDADGILTVMGTFGGNDSRAFDINDLGIIVGFSTNASNARRAMISEDGGLSIIDLNTLVVDLTGWLSLDESYGINESGQIVGVGTLSNGVKGAFLLTPTAVVPLPAAAWLFLSGLATMAALRRRQAAPTTVRP